LQHLDDYTNMQTAKYKAGNYFDDYMKIAVKVTGTDPDTGDITNIPSEEYKITTFEEMNFEPQLLENVKKYGYVVPTPVQQR